jgi:uncharacterized protein
LAATAWPGTVEHQLQKPIAGILVALVPSAFNVRAPLSSGDVFLMNTLTDAQLIVSPDVAGLLDSFNRCEKGGPALGPETEEARQTLAEHGFLVAGRAIERDTLEAHFATIRASATDLCVTVLTTMQCNLACEYCYQGDRGPSASPALHMTLETAGRVVSWIERELACVGPRRLVLTFFGGEPLLNLPVMYAIAGRCLSLTRARGIDQRLAVITNGLLLTRDVVERLLPLGLHGVKVTLDGDRDTHDRKRPQRGGQGTFDRIIANMRHVADLVPITVGGNFDSASVGQYPALLEYLGRQDFAPRLAEVTFKPVVPPAAAQAPDRGCRGAGSGAGGHLCDSCHLADEQMALLRTETRRRGFPTADGLHTGPCELYRQHAHTIGVDGSLYGCPGFTGDNARSTGHIDREPDAAEAAEAGVIERLAPWRQCGDCAFVPVCGGGCAVAAQSERGDMLAPSCHKRSLEAALFELAERSAHLSEGA